MPRPPGNRGRNDRSGRNDDRGRRQGGSRDGRRRDDDRGRSDRGRSERGRSGARDRRDDRGRPDRDSRDPRDRDPRDRPPVRGRRKTFDTDSAPNAREQADAERRRQGSTPDGTAEEEARGRGEETWIDEGPVRREATDAVRRGGAGGRGGQSGERRNGSKPAGSGSGGSRNAKRRRQRTRKRVEDALEIDRDRLVRRLGTAKADRALARFADATQAFSEDRLEDARSQLKPVVDLLPDEPAVRELHGLTLYRLGRWRQAVTELEAFADRTGSTDQHPVLADCHRAMGHHRKVAELWEDLGAASPDAATIAEGRIVYAGSLADRGDLAAAIKVLEAGSLGSKDLKDHHLRMRYALGDLYDRAGEHQAARRQFEAVARQVPDFFDVRERLDHL